MLALCAGVRLGGAGRGWGPPSEARKARATLPTSQCVAAMVCVVPALHLAARKVPHARATRPTYVYHAWHAQRRASVRKRAQGRATPRKAAQERERPRKSAQGTGVVGASLIKAPPAQGPGTRSRGTAPRPRPRARETGSARGRTRQGPRGARGLWLSSPSRSWRRPWRRAWRGRAL